MSSKFKCYEVVELRHGQPVIAPVIGLRGAVLGMAQCDDGRWVYAVQVLGKP